MHALWNNFRVPIVALLAILALPQAHAVDGVVLIDQNRALAGGVTPGDAPGFPITISVPGSYRLASNLAPPAFVTAIEITAADVTIDLNGFSLIAPPHDLSIFDTGVMMRGPGVQGVTVKNGTIHGFQEPIRLPDSIGPGGILVPRPALLKDLTLILTDGRPSLSFIVPGYVLLQGITGPGIDLVLLCPVSVSGSAVRNISIIANPNAPTARCAIANNATN